MRRLKMLKRFLAFAMAFVISAGLFSDKLVQPSVTIAESESFDVSSYAQRLQEISQEQERLDEELKETNENIADQTQREYLILQKIKSINDKCKILNGYMTQLEIEMATNQRLIDEKTIEIENGVNDFKKRLRAMYLAGDESYTSILLNSNDFFDILMRMELVKRVAKHDNEMIDKLIELRNELETAKTELEAQQVEYDAQYAELNAQKAEQADLYEQSMTAKAEMIAEKERIQKENEAYLEERRQFESDLSDILKSSYGDSSDETMRAAAELAANAALDSIRESFRVREENGEEIPENECRYEFSWPVPGCYNITSGVGERWGSYHKGIDIAGGRGTGIHAVESGTVIRINTTCPHDYGKDASCGCGGGYGNFIIIDHGNEFISLYGHLTALDVQVGDVVNKGDLIGYMGSTGYSTGDHLHLEIRYQGYFLNPAAYVSF